MSKYTVKAGMHFVGETLVKVGDTVESKAELDPRFFTKLPETKTTVKDELKGKAKTEAKTEAEADALKVKEEAAAKAKADKEVKGGTADNAGNFPEGGTGAAGQK